MINYEIPHDTENLEEHIIAIHLKNVIPETVAHKLMNGVHIEQDGKQLINKKSIKLFLQYLCEKMYNAAKNNKNKTQNVKAVAKEGTGQFTAKKGDGNETVARGYLMFRDRDGIRVIYAD